MEQLQANLEFVCKHEERPELSQETQQLYHYALYNDLHNMWTGKKRRCGVERIGTLLSYRRNEWGL